MAYQNKNMSLARTAAPSNPVAELKSLANRPDMFNRFKQVIGDKAPQFLASVVSAVSTNKELLKADPNSILASAMVAATLDLDVNPSLGFSALVPYNRNRPIKDGDGNIIRWERSTDAQFQIMTKGLVQLAIRSGQYKNINVTEVYEDEFDSVDIISGELRMHAVEDGQRSRGETGMIVGYVAYLKLVSGFEKTVYWSLDKIIQHAQKFSQSYDQKTGRFRKGSAWDTNFEAMCKKTVLKNALSSWGILSTQMQKAIVSDDFEIIDPEPTMHENPIQNESLEEGENTTHEPASDKPEKTPRFSKNKSRTASTKKEREPGEDEDDPYSGQGPESSYFDQGDEAAMDALWGGNA